MNPRVFRQHFLVLRQPAINVVWWLLTAPRTLSAAISTARIYRLAGGGISGGGEWATAHRSQRMTIACEYYASRDDKLSHKI
ncbi:hypothetical protein, partial [Klebsiella michiganensis]|uniref:hypothetical protein n=1 Tax=Klebsiella michiganensis TaxID=1134687 RepID=UPI001CCF5110